MDRTTLLLIALICILFLGSFMTESFVDVSGQYVTVSLKDLFALMGNQKSQNQNQNQNQTSSVKGDDMYKNMKDSIVGDVRQTVRDTLQAKSEGNVLTDSCIDSVVNQQGTEWMRYIPGKNPADYIRKDSIPCYGCTIPT
jgi:hypothetical protein